VPAPIPGDGVTRGSIYSKTIQRHTLLVRPRPAPV